MFLVWGLVVVASIIIGGFWAVIGAVCFGATGGSEKVGGVVVGVLVGLLMLFLLGLPIQTLGPLS